MLVIIGIAYLLLFEKKSNLINLQKNAFILNYSAFKNGIKFANIKFRLHKNNKQKFNLWTSRKKGLDFNGNGFPIGTSISNNEQRLPETPEQCREIWRFVLGPLQPKLKLELNDDNYWTTLSLNNECFYHYSTQQPHIIYSSITGKVTLSG